MTDEFDRAFLLGAIAGAPLAILGFALVLAVLFYLAEWRQHRRIQQRQAHHQKVARLYPPRGET